MAIKAPPRRLNEDDANRLAEEFGNRSDSIPKQVNVIYKNPKKLDLRALSLDDLAEQLIDIERQSHILKGQILLEARSRFNADTEFGKWRSEKFSDRLSEKMANNLMHLAKFFDDKKLGNIPVSAGYLISAPQHEDIADVVYKRVIELDKPSLKDVKSIIHELKPETSCESRDGDNIEVTLLHLNKMTKNQLIELLVNNFTQKQLNKLVCQK